jgi:3-oxoacyl-ACP reductase-like protein
VRSQVASEVKPRGEPAAPAAPVAPAAPAAAETAAKAAEKEKNNQSNVDSLLGIVEINLKDVFDTLNKKTHSSDVTQNPTNKDTNEALNLIQFLIKFHDETNESN